MLNLEKNKVFNLMTWANIFILRVTLANTSVRTRTTIYVLLAMKLLLWWWSVMQENSDLGILLLSLYKKRSFKPSGICADSQYRILTVDSDNNCIHILDKDGQFLRYIDNCNFDFPWGICLDSKDNLFVVEIDRRKVKKIQYYISNNVIHNFFFQKLVNS